MDNNRSNRFFLYGILGLLLPLEPNLFFSTTIGLFGALALLFGALACLNQNYAVGWPSAVIGLLLIIFMVHRYHRYHDANPLGEGARGRRSAPVLLVVLVNLSFLSNLYALVTGELRNFAILYPIAMIALVIYFDLAWLRNRRKVEN